jgi:hypothetical protein
MGVWPDSTIFVPGRGDIAIPVGSVTVFSGSKSHAGSAYEIGNRRLHFYFFSSKTWQSGTSPLENVDAFFATRKRLIEEELTEDDRLLLERSLMNNLQVYDFKDGEGDAFDNPVEAAAAEEEEEEEEKEVVEEEVEEEEPI